MNTQVKSNELNQKIYEISLCESQTLLISCHATLSMNEDEYSKFKILDESDKEQYLLNEKNVNEIDYNYDDFYILNKISSNSYQIVDEVEVA